MQNYLKFESNFCKPRNVAGMGSPISGLVAEIFLLSMRT